MLQSTAAGTTDVNCIMQMCQASLAADVRNLCLLALSLSILTVLGLYRAFPRAFGAVQSAALAVAQVRESPGSFRTGQDRAGLLVCVFNIRDSETHIRVWLVCSACMIRPA